MGASSTQRTWIGLSLSDEVTVQPLPSNMTRAYLQSIDIEVGFNRRGHEVAEQYSADEMAKNFLKAFNDMIFGVGEILVFDFHGQNLKAIVKGLSIVELPSGSAGQNMGILMDQTEVTFMKASDSLIKLKSSAKKYVYSIYQ